MRFWFPFAALFAIPLMLVSVVNGQVLTGNLSGTVKDVSGAAVGNANVRLVSPALFGGVLSTITNETGQFRFPELPIASYRLEASSSGFADYSEDNIRIELGASLEREVILQIPGLRESIVVKTSVSLLDTRRPGLSNTFSFQDHRNIPILRRGMLDFISVTAGISPASAIRGANFSVFGSGVNENAFLVDGSNSTCPCSGGLATQLDVDAVEEVQVQPIGAPAEYGNIQGAVFNAVTRQGGNDFQFDASYYGQRDGLTSHPVRLFCNRCSQRETAYTRAKHRDFTSHVGLPVVRDRVWFFGGYRYFRTSDSQPGTDPQFPFDSQSDLVFWKVTARVTPKLKLMHSFQDVFWVTPDRPTLSRPVEATATDRGSQPNSTFGQLTYAVSNNTLWDARVSRFVSRAEYLPSTGNLTIPSRFDQTTGFYSGGPPSFGWYPLSRTSLKASIAHYASNLMRGDHELKAGVQFENGHHESYTVVPGGAQYTDFNSRPFRATFREPYSSAGTFHSTGLFADDAVHLWKNLTMTIGVRFDHSRAISSDVRARDAQGRQTDRTIRGLGKLYTWNVVSPRLGLAMKLSGDGRTIARTSYGRFYQGVLTGEIDAVHPGITPSIDAFFDPATGRYSRVVAVRTTNANLTLDPHTKTPHTDQFSLSLDREFLDRFVMTLAYVKKSGKDFTGWKDIGGIYETGTTLLPGGRVFPIFSLANATADQLFLLTNPAEYFLKYNGATISLQKRGGGRWSILTSYTFSKTEGLQASSAGRAGSAQFSSPFGGVFGRDPNTLINARGRLPNDRPHMFRSMGSITLPKLALDLATNFQHMTGLPWAATAIISLPQGQQRVLLEPRGSKRLSSQTLLDLRLSRSWRLTETVKMELLLDVFNLLNDKAEQALADENFFSQNFGRPSAFVDPRRAMFGFRFTMGQ